MTLTASVLNLSKKTIKHGYCIPKHQFNHLCICKDMIEQNGTEKYLVLVKVRKKTISERK